MLNHKQLIDIASCKTLDCRKCSCSHICGSEPVIASMAAEAALKYQDMLKRLEWANECLTRKYKGHYLDYCPSCENHKEQGHARDCELAVLLKEDEG